MEFRSNERKPLALHVVISYPGLGLVCGRTRDVSLGGMFVETGQVILPRNQQVGLCFHLSMSGDDLLCVADARVVHNGTYGVGLGFRQMEKRIYEALRELLGRPAAEVPIDTARPGRQKTGVSIASGESWKAVGGLS